MSIWKNQPQQKRSGTFIISDSFKVKCKSLSMWYVDLHAADTRKCLSENEEHFSFVTDPISEILLAFGRCNELLAFSGRFLCQILELFRHLAGLRTPWTVQLLARPMSYILCPMDSTALHNAAVCPCHDWDSNPRSRCSSCQDSAELYARWIVKYRIWTSVCWRLFEPVVDAVFSCY